MTSSRVSLLALGLGAYLAFAIVSFPASIAHRWFAPEALALAGVEGTIWRGTVAYGGINGLAFSDLRWQLRPAALLTGRIDLSAEARLPGGFVRTGLAVSGGGIRLRDLAASTTLASFERVLRIPGVRGDLSLSLAELELVDGWPVAATGELRLANLSAPPLIPVQGITSIELGAYSARLTTTDAAAVSAIVTDDGGGGQVGIGGKA